MSPSDPETRPVKAMMTIKNLEQLRLLSDPLKLSLIQVFAEAEGTVASAAEALGEPQTKLYRHVDALLEAGLIEVTRERPKRGTVERWFRTVARRFTVADGLLSSEESGAEAESVRNLLRGAEAEILQALQDKDEAVAPTVARARAHVSPAQLEGLRERLFAWLEALEEEDSDEAESVEVGAMIALYRMPEKGAG